MSTTRARLRADSRGIEATAVPPVHLGAKRLGGRHPLVNACEEGFVLCIASLHSVAICTKRDIVRIKRYDAVLGNPSMAGLSLRTEFLLPHGKLQPERAASTRLSRA